jgi:hypothetical protein
VSNGQDCRPLGNGPSQRPAISEGGTSIFFDTDATNFTCYSSGRDRNGAIADVFIWTERRQGAILFGFDTDKQPLGFESRNPATSARTNYYLWKTRDPFTDVPLARRAGWHRDPAGTRARAAQDPRFHQIYLRYGGPE